MSHSSVCRERRKFRRVAIAVLLAWAAWLVPVPAGAQTGTVSGTVTNAATGATVAGGRVRLCPASGLCVNSATTTADGTYSVTVPAGTYYAFTTGFNTQGLLNEIFDDKACVLGCSDAEAIATGTPIAVAGAATVTGRNFALTPGGTVTGTITDAATGNPLAGVTVTLWTRLSAGTINFVASAASDASGVYTVQAVRSGTYYATTGNTQGYINEIFNDIFCTGSCNATLAVASGTGIAATAGAVTGGVDFGLLPGGRITGTVTNQTSTLPMANVLVRALAPVNGAMTAFGSALTNGSGAYAIQGLPTGSYFLQTTTSAAINETYDNRPCATLTCTPAEAAGGDATAVTAGTTVSGRDFQLDPGASISGTVRSTDTGNPLASAGVQAFRQSGATSALVATAGVDASGNYVIGGLPPDTYYLVAYDLIENASGYVQELLGGTHCPYCEGAGLLGATPLVLAAGASSAGNDFSLDRAGAITGTVTETSTGLPLRGIVSAYVPGTSHPVGEAFSDETGVYFLNSLPPGPVFLSTRGFGRHLNEIYNDVPCAGGVCTGAATVASGASVVAVSATTVSNVNFALSPRNEPPGAPVSLRATSTAFTVQISWAESGSGGVTTSYVLEAGFAPGTTAVTLPVASTSLTVPGVAPGTYYLRVRAVNALGTSPPSNEVALMIGADGASQLSPPASFVAWTAGDRLTATWAAPTLGPTPTG
ncbi:MAG: carboxypeptidase regulatory-like domain-containing protein, partial [Vicinamibacterales bacterium]